MNKYVIGNKAVIVVLHEIYGVNQFIEETCIKYFKKGYDVISPSLINNYVFEYNSEETAYNYFTTNVGFNVEPDKLGLIKKLKNRYEKVYILGFSVGATLAWICSEKIKCDGVICCYGSRIRNFLSVDPVSPVLLIFAEQDSIDSANVFYVLSQKPMTKTYILPAKHGFMDRYGKNFSKQEASIAENIIDNFLTEK